MPSRNVIKIDIPQSYYHVYARGHGRQAIFRDEDDYRKFEDLFERYLSERSPGIGERKLYGEVSLLGYCLLDNEFHLLLYQASEGAMSKLMRGIMTSYSMYFNRKYGLSGALFESRYKASRISDNENLKHISRYIHLIPKDWMAYPHSSIHSYYLGAPDWLEPSRIVEIFGTLPMYADFLNDADDYKESLEIIKDELANKLER